MLWLGKNRKSLRTVPALWSILSVANNIFLGVSLQLIAKPSPVIMPKHIVNSNGVNLLGVLLVILKSFKINFSLPFQLMPEHSSGINWNVGPKLILSSQQNPSKFT